MFTFQDHEHTLKHIYDDGGRFEAGFDKAATMGDCVTRAASIAVFEGDYHEAHKSLSKISLFFNADYGVVGLLFLIYLRLRGFKLVRKKSKTLNDSMFLEQGTRIVFMKLTGRKVFGLFRMGHATTVVDGVVLDTMDARFMDHEVVAVFEKIG